jgi:hypothetical protein
MRRPQHPPKTVATPDRPKSELWLRLLVILAVAAFYLWTATSSHPNVTWGARQTDHLNQLAEGILSGHLYLPQQPPPQMLALKDPLDPVANRPYRPLHDASLYHGHYYVYFGPVPVFTLFVPWRAITGSGIPGIYAALLYMLGGYIFSCLLLFLLLRASDVRLSWFTLCAATAALGLCQTAPLLMRRASMYETPIAAGFCFLMGGMYFLARDVIEEAPRPWYAILAGLFLGLTPGCRPNYVVVVAPVCALYALHLWRSRGLRGEALLRALVRFGSPIAVCALLLASYNWARFGNPLETGQGYQLTSNVVDRGLGGGLGSFFPSLYKLLLERPLVFSHFPFFELVNRGPFGSDLWSAGADSVEYICGLLVISPLCLAGLTLPFFLRRFGGKLSPALRFLLIALGVSAAANLIAIAIVVRQPTQRYELDFAPALLLSALFVMFYLSARIESIRPRRIVVGLLAAVMLIGAIEQAGLSINSDADGLMQHNPAEFNRLASLFGDDDNSVRRYVFGLAMEGEIAFPSRPAGTRGALLTTGMAGAANAIFVEYLAGDKARLGYFTTPRGTHYGPEIPIVPGQRYRISVRYLDAVRAMSVTIGKTIALQEFTYFFPTSFRAATVGRNDFGIAPFSGDLKVQLRFAPAP